VVNFTSLSVFWNPPPFPDQNGVITGYRVIINNVNQSSERTIDITITSFTAKDLKQLEVYDIRVAAMTAIGLGPFYATRIQILAHSKCFVSMCGM